MGLRHKAIKDTLEVGTAAEWNDDHLADFSDELVYEYSPISIPVANVWDTAQTAAGSAPVVAFTDNHTGVYFVTGGVTDQTSSMRHERATVVGDITFVDDAPIMNMAVWMEAYHTVGNVAEFGLIPSGTALFTANQDGAYFRIFDNKLYAVTGSGAAETATDITPVLGISEYAAYRIELGAATCSFYVEDMETPAATHTTNLPDADLTMKFSVRSKNNVDSKMYVDGVALTRNRYKG